MKKMYRAVKDDNKELSGTVLFGALVVAIALMIAFQTPKADEPQLRQAKSESADLSNADSTDTKLVNADSNSHNQNQ